MTSLKALVAALLLAGVLGGTLAGGEGRRNSWWTKRSFNAPLTSPPANDVIRKSDVTAGNDATPRDDVSIGKALTGQKDLISPADKDGPSPLSTSGFSLALALQPCRLPVGTLCLYLRPVCVLCETCN
ncbi:uncharacterized protein LOC119586693 [Penaeus monodon]|uniref:uncharacterized protein LOC119586693 n=1 Tax=Penaeus monodon TaxID=6687 RepID=UPI0018A7CC8D|nr:uncharacterized protein LOC119586693 [Penaeus monodon]